MKRKYLLLQEEITWGLGIGDWGLGIGDWGLGPIPNPQSPIPNPQSPLHLSYNNIYNILLLLRINKYINFPILNNQFYNYEKDSFCSLF